MEVNQFNDRFAVTTKNNPAYIHLYQTNHSGEVEFLTEALPQISHVIQPYKTPIDSKSNSEMKRSTYKNN